jgi:hypothetical protein
LDFYKGSILWRTAPEDFANTTHLSPYVAEKLTKIVDEIIRKQIQSQETDRQGSRDKNSIGQKSVEIGHYPYFGRTSVGQ